MDVNGTRFHLILGPDDWGPLIAAAGSPPAALAWDEDYAGVSLAPLLFRFPAPPGDRPPRLADRRGAARDVYGNWYWIDDNAAEIRFLSPGREESQHFWSAADGVRRHGADCPPGDFGPIAPPAPPPPLALRGLAVTDEHYLVVGALDPPGLLVFDLHAGGPPIQMLWPEAVPFRPFDMAPRPGGGVWILDRPLDRPAAGEARYWALDRYFRVETCDQAELTLRPPRVLEFQPAGGGQSERGEAGRTFPAGISLDMASPLPELEPVSIESLPDGTVLIMTTQAYSELYRYYFGRQLAPALSLEHALLGYIDDEPSPANPNPYGVQGHDLAFVPGASTPPAGAAVAGTAYIVASDGNQAFAFYLEAADIELVDSGAPALALRLIEAYYPLRRFSGKALVAAGGQAYYDLRDRWLPVVTQPRPRYEIEGRLETGILDGREPDCVWHRLFVDGRVPNGTQVVVESRAANRPELLAAAAWRAEPALYRRATGDEIPYHPPDQVACPTGQGTWELLFQRAVGRYLQLRLTLRGTGRASPRIHALRAYYPRFSYLREYLPAAYRQDETSASFLDRFLANVEGTCTVLEGRIAEAQCLFDVRIVPAEFLDWLAGWFGATLDPAWDEARRRLFIEHAVELFRQRGTPAGLIRTVRLAIDPCPDDSLFEQDVVDASACTSDCLAGIYTVRIVEHFVTRGGYAGLRVAYGDPTVPDVPRLTTADEPWTSDQGAGPLHRQFRDYLRARYKTAAALGDAWHETISLFDEVFLSPVLPASEARAADWCGFTQQELDFPYAEVTAADAPRYREFLSARYRQVAALNAAYRTAYTSFAAVHLPAEDDMPAAGKRLYDWIQFVSLVLPIDRNAHRFSVLVPIDPRRDMVAQAEQIAVVDRIVTLEKPAHTDFEVQPYWALFRVGEARLGLDTLLGAGSRFVAVLLGQTALAEGYLTAPHPWNVDNRIVSDRDAVGSRLVL